MKKTTKFKKACLLFFLLSLLSPLHAQDSSIRPIQISDIRQSTPQDLAALPANVRQIREEQLRLAQEDNVAIEIIDSPEKSQTIIHQVPDFLSSRTISNEDEAIAFIQDLYPYYGFGGTESLRMERKIGETYRYRQYIDDIWTPHVVLATVDMETGYIQWLSGSTILILIIPGRRNLARRKQ